MADVKLSALPAVASTDAADSFVVLDTGVAKLSTTTQLVTYLQTIGMPIVKKLSALQQTTSTTFAKVTGLDQTLSTGTWVFHYYLQWRTTQILTAIKLATNFSGTAGRFLVEATGFEATTAASTGVETAIHPAFGLRAGGQNNVASASTII